jgi:hypothetical protein
MMVIALTGGTLTEQQQIVTEMRSGLSAGWMIEHLKHDGLTQEARYSSLARLYLSRLPKNTAVVVSGVKTQAEYDKLRMHRALICVVHGPLSSLFTRMANPLDRQICYIAAKKFPVKEPTKRAQYIQPDEAFSLCYARYHRFKESL